MNYFVHPQGICESSAIGARTKIWAFAMFCQERFIGEDCNVCDHVFIENDVIIGNRVTVKCGVQLWDGLRVEDDVFIGPNATFTNDPLPKSKQRPEQFEITYLRRAVRLEQMQRFCLASRLVKMPWSVLARWSPSPFLPMLLCKVIRADL
jgi:NDP-sugar pyrophosphorylase family protein